MAIEILKKLITYPTITPREGGIYDYIKTLLPDFEILEIHKEDVKNIFLYKIPKDARADTAFENLEHICFAGHVDVVPPGGDNGKDWAHPPFSANIEDGYIYGRGAQDMKGGIACFIKAIRDFIKRNDPRFIISILLTSDEEGDGIYGSRYALEELKRRRMLPKKAIVAEPTCDKIVGDTIKIGRRGSINGEIIIEGKQGHVAYPSKCVNPVELLGKRLGDIAGVNLDNGDKYFEPTKLVITNIRAGIGVSNVTPNELYIMFNARNSTLTTLEDIRSHIDSVLKTLPYKLTLKESAKSFITKDMDFRDILAKSAQACSGVKANFSATGGVSDARFFAEHNISVLELGVCNDRIHALNERVSIKDIETLTNIFLRFLEDMN